MNPLYALRKYYQIKYTVEINRKENCYYLIRRYTHGDTVGILKSPKASTTYTGEDCNISLFFKQDVTNKEFR
jgi:hypothetical protein